MASSTSYALAGVIRQRLARRHHQRSFGSQSIISKERRAGIVNRAGSPRHHQPKLRLTRASSTNFGSRHHPALARARQCKLHQATSQTAHLNPPPLGALLMSASAALRSSASSLGTLQDPHPHGLTSSGTTGARDTNWHSLYFIV
jgi:hypothetical protein